jgi:tetratricopeptide (TPR) repeat protein
LLIVEDVHCCDAAALGYLVAIAETVSLCPSVLLLTSRIDGDPLELSLRGQIANVSLSIIELGPLRRDEALSLAGKLGIGDDRNAAAFVDRANGNPLFLEQLLQSAGGTSLGDLPATVRSVILSRIDGLDPVDRKAIQAASVLGQRFTTAALRHVLGDEAYDCGRLVRHRLLRPDAGELAFSHALIREGISSSLLKARRQDLHRRAAEWFADRDAVVFAEHLERAGDARAAGAYLSAAKQQAAAYRDEKALELVRRGLGLAQSSADTRSLTGLEGQLLHSLGTIPEALAAYQRALENAETGSQRCDAWIGMAECMRIEDRFAEAFAILDQAEAVAMQADLKAHLSRIHHLRGNLLMSTPDTAHTSKPFDMPSRWDRLSSKPMRLAGSAMRNMPAANSVRRTSISGAASSWPGLTASSGSRPQTLRWWRSPQPATT